MAERNLVGQQSPYDHQSQHNTIEFIIKQALARIATVTLVKVVAVTNNGDVSPVGFLSAQPMVNQLDGAGRAVPHAVIHGMPYLRMQGGTNAVIMDPKPGDIGIAGFSNRDLSNVKGKKDFANPGSHRRFSYADGLFLGGCLNGTPTQYIRFTDDGIDITTPLPITINAQNILLDEGGNLSVKGEVTAMAQGAGFVTLSKHARHVGPGADTPPMPGS